jgi:response regulator RpfG family c-di-GMP phosphodiesterase
MTAWKPGGRAASTTTSEPFTISAVSNDNQKRMSERILFVDDDPNLLAGCERNFRRRFQLDTAAGGEAGLAKLAERGPYAVVVSDRQMPGIDGIQFLAAVRQRAPDTVRIMLSGNVDLEAAVRVVNEGNIFRFLIKPCPPDILAKAIEDAQAQYRLLMAEKELLSKTLSGSVKLLMDILSNFDIKSFGRTEQLRGLINKFTRQMSVENAWEVHLAAMLAPIGYVTLPPEIVMKSRNGEPLTKIQEQLITSAPEIAARLVANIPRLESVANTVRYHEKHYDGTGFPADAVKGEALPFGSRLLRILFDMKDLQGRGVSSLEALNQMQQREGWYDPQLIALVRAGVEETESAPDAARSNIPVCVGDLTVGMMLHSDILAKDGTVVLPAAHVINEMSLEKIQNFDRMSGIQEPIFVEVAG